MNTGYSWVVLVMKKDLAQKFQQRKHPIAFNKFNNTVPVGLLLFRIRKASRVEKAKTLSKVGMLLGQRQ